MPKITQARIAEFLAIQKKRKALSRKTDALDRQEKAFRDEFLAAVEAAGGVLKLGRFTLAAKDGQVYPKWKDELIARLGAAVADKIAADTKPAQILVVVERKGAAAR